MIHSESEPWYNKPPRDWQNAFLITGVHYIRVLFHTFYNFWAEKYHSLCQSLRYMGVRYIGFHYKRGNVNNKEQNPQGLGDNIPLEIVEYKDRKTTFPGSAPVSWYITWIVLFVHS